MNISEKLKAVLLQVFLQNNRTLVRHVISLCNHSGFQCIWCNGLHFLFYVRIKFCSLAISSSCTAFAMSCAHYRYCFITLYYSVVLVMLIDLFNLSTR